MSKLKAKSEATLFILSGKDEKTKSDEKFFPLPAWETLCICICSCLTNRGLLNYMHELELFPELSLLVFTCTV